VSGPVIVAFLLN